MELTRKQFDILSALATSKDKLSQRELEDICGYSPETINKILKDFTEINYVNDGEITPEGINAL